MYFNDFFLIIKKQESKLKALQEITQCFNHYTIDISLSIRK